MANGDDIPIEERDRAEVLAPYGCEIAPAHYHARNPAFDITPNKYLSGLVTECGIVLPPFTETLPKAVQSGRERRE